MPTYQVEVHNKVSVVSETKVGQAKVSTSAAVSDSYVKVSSGSVEESFKNGSSPIKVETRFVEQSAEGKVSVEQNVRGVTIYANNKTTADKKGVTNTTSVGAKISVGSQNNKAEGYGEGFGSYTNRGSLSGGFKVGGDVINTKKSTTGNTTLKTESKTGGSVSAFWKWLTDF